jgi:hypothetical protein
MSASRRKLMVEGRAMAVGNERCGEQARPSLLNRLGPGRFWRRIGEAGRVTQARRLA